MERLSEDVVNFLKSADRYKNFTILDEPAAFKDVFKDKDYDIIISKTTLNKKQGRFLLGKRPAQLFSHKTATNVAVLGFFYFFFIYYWD